MRTLLKVQMEVEAGNRAIRDGSFGELMDRLMADLQPEAAYFTAIDGKRTALIFFDLDDPSRIPAIAEPLFMTVGASIDLMPAMNADEVRAGLEAAAPAFATAH